MLKTVLPSRKSEPAPEGRSRSIPHTKETLNGQWLVPVHCSRNSAPLGVWSFRCPTSRVQNIRNHQTRETITANKLEFAAPEREAAQRTRNMETRNILPQSGEFQGVAGTAYRRSLTPFFPATVFFGPFRVRAFVRVRWPRTGRFLRWRIPR